MRDNAIEEFEVTSTFGPSSIHLRFIVQQIGIFTRQLEEQITNGVCPAVIYINAVTAVVRLAFSKPETV